MTPLCDYDYGQVWRLPQNFRMTQLWQQTTSAKNLAKFEHLIFEIL